ncbi:MAG: tyrosine-type recombinase/integrase [archaeon]|nr:tyrosine-type recombinase/integrase [archaeon]
MAEIKNSLPKFHDFCLVDLQLSKRTVLQHKYNLRKFLNWLNNKAIEVFGIDDLRNYLMEFRNGNPYTYSNMLKALRRFFRDFLAMPEIVRSFKLPPKPNPIIKRVPAKEELKRFYEALEMREKAIFLLMASSGLRRSEALNLKLNDVDFEKRMIIPNHDSKTKRSYMTFYNEEAENILKKWLEIRPKNSDRLFPMRSTKQHRLFVEAREKTGIQISPQILREWFACEMGRLGVPDRYVDAFCGRVPRSVLARHYTDFSPERLKEIYDKANLKILS